MWICCLILVGQGLTQGQSIATTLLVDTCREADLPPYAHNVAKSELKRLKKMSPQMPEYPMIRHYLELVADLPWGKTSKEQIDIKKSRQVTYKNVSAQFNSAAIE